jgi:hypothetical protein
MIGFLATRRARSWKRSVSEAQRRNAGCALPRCRHRILSQLQRISSEHSRATSSSWPAMAFCLACFGGSSRDAPTKSALVSAAVSSPGSAKPCASALPARQPARLEDEQRGEVSSKVFLQPGQEVSDESSAASTRSAGAAESAAREDAARASSRQPAEALKGDIVDMEVRGQGKRPPRGSLRGAASLRCGSHRRAGETGGLQLEHASADRYAPSYSKCSSCEQACRYLQGNSKQLHGAGFQGDSLSSDGPLAVASSPSLQLGQRPQDALLWRQSEPVSLPQRPDGSDLSDDGRNELRDTEVCECACQTRQHDAGATG